MRSRLVFAALGAVTLIGGSGRWASSALFVGNWKRVMPTLFQVIPQKVPLVSKIR
jgi:hypothetical protein